MTCFHPLTGHRDGSGKVTFGTPSKSYIDRPVTVACGQCQGCRLERSRQWAVRCHHEASLHEANSFITLTYTDEHLPTNYSINVKTWQKFARKLRKKMGSFRYFHCGEYGDLYQRPHYHACLFGIDFREDRIYYTTVRGNKLFTSPTLDKLWGHGYATIGEVTFKSAAYCARYIMKKINGNPAKEHYEWTNNETGETHQRSPEYTTMSRRPGIGKKWINKWGKEVYRDDFIIINGKRTRPPKYYDQQLEVENPNEMEKIKTKRVQEAQKHAKDNTWEKLLIKEQIQKSKYNLYKREIKI